MSLDTVLNIHEHHLSDLLSVSDKAIEILIE